MFRYGWRATAAERDFYIERVVADAPGDWLNDAIDPQLLRNMLQRCFIESDGLWLRRPTLEEIAIASAPAAEGDTTASTYQCCLCGQAKDSLPTAVKT